MKKLITVLCFTFILLLLSTPVYAEYKTAYIFPKELNVHTQPNEESRIMDKVYAGQEVEVVDVQGDWAKICITLDSYGWINAYFFEYHIYDDGNYDDSSSSDYYYDDNYYYDDYDYSSCEYHYSEETVEYSEDEEIDEEVHYYYDEESDETVYYYDEKDEDTGEVTRHSVTTSGNTTGTAIAEYAQQFVGNPYVWGGESLTNGADCSGFTQAVYADMGISIGRTAAEQAEGGEEVSLDDLQAGDILYYYNDEGRIGHVTIYNGDGTVTHASNPENGIKISDIDYRIPAGARRYVSNDSDEDSYEELDAAGEEEDIVYYDDDEVYG